MNPVGPIIDPDDLAKTAHLELLSKLMVDGLLAGRHRSKMKGGCAEFAEHRAYSPGDEIRLLDWRVFAKSDRYVIKQYRGGDQPAGHHRHGRQRFHGLWHEHRHQISIRPGRLPLPGPHRAGTAGFRRPGGHGRRPARLHSAPGPGQPSGGPEPKLARQLSGRPHLHGRGLGGNRPAHQAPRHRPAFLRLFRPGGPPGQGAPAPALAPPRGSPLPRHGPGRTFLLLHPLHPLRADGVGHGPPGSRIPEPSGPITWPASKPSWPKSAASARSVPATTSPCPPTGPSAMPWPITCGAEAPRPNSTCSSSHKLFSGLCR